MTRSQGAVFPAQATQKRRAVVVLVKRSTSSGAAALRALLSSLEEVTGFQVISYTHRPAAPQPAPCGP